MRSVGALIAIALAAAGCSAGASKRTPRVAVTVGRAETRAMPNEITANGVVEPRQTAAVGSPVGGVITRVAFHEGDDVGEGQVLFQLDPKPFQAAFEQARATLARDVALANNAKLQADRSKVLVAQNLISPEEEQDKRATASSLEAQARADSAAVANARLNLHYASISAPISGRTGSLMMHEGDYVKPNTSDPLVTINQIHPILVRFTVPATVLPQLQKSRGKKLPVLVSSDESDSSSWISGTLVFMDNAVDGSTGTLLLKAEFSNKNGELWPGQFVSVRLVQSIDPSACVVPAQAVSQGQAGAYVFVLNPDSTVTPRNIEVARTTNEYAVIASGLKPGEQVITDGQMRLTSGARVEVKRPAAAKTASAS